jgi:hypothetical protein
MVSVMTPFSLLWLMGQIVCSDRLIGFIGVARSLLRAYISLRDTLPVIQAETSFWKTLPSLDLLITCSQTLTDGKEISSEDEDRLRTLHMEQVQRPTTRMTGAAVRDLLRQLSKKTQVSMNEYTSVINRSESVNACIFAAILTKRVETLKQYLKVLDLPTASKGGARHNAPQVKVNTRVSNTLTTRVSNTLVTELRPFYQVCKASFSLSD